MATPYETKIMAQEIERAQHLIAQAVAEIEEHGGSIRYFNAALMSAAMVLHANVEGPETVDAALTKTAKALLVKGGAGSC